MRLVHLGRRRFWRGRRRRALLGLLRVGVDVTEWKKEPAVEVAQIGFDALMKRDADIVVGWKSKLQTAVAHVLPSGVLSEMHRKQAEPGSAIKKH